MRRLFSLALLACACATKPQPAPQPVEPPRTATMLLFPGERLSARVDRGGVDLASIELRYQAPCRASEHVVVPVTVRAETAGIAAALRGGRLEGVSWLDRARGVPRWSEVLLDTSKRRTELEIAFAAGAYHYRQQRGERPSQERTRPLPSGPVHDAVSALGVARALGDGARRRLHVLVGRRLWQLDLRHAGRESVRVGGEAQEAVRVSGSARRMLSRSFRARGKPVALELWLSDDAYRMPLRARLTRREKSIELELVDYELTPEKGELGPCDQPRSQRRVDM